MYVQIVEKVILFTTVFSTSNAINANLPSVAVLPDSTSVNPGGVHVSKMNHKELQS